MSKIARCRILGLGIILLWCSSCHRVPITGRQQLNLVPDSIINSMSYASYNEFLSSHKLSDNQQETQMVQAVGRRMEKAVARYCAEHDITLRGYQWEFNLVQDKEVNAWAMPGGKVVVYTGLLPIAQDEAGLAVVMGHEIAHVIAKHGSERMSQGLIVQFGDIALSQALSKYPTQTQNLFLQAYGLGTQIGVLLPYSRVHETEADRLGLIFTAMAGYDPHAAVGFWERMAAQKEGQKTPELLSTHPADATRIKNIKNFIPEAMKYYQPAEPEK